MNVKEIEITDEEFDELIDAMHGQFKMGNLLFDASTIMKELDPIAYQCDKSTCDTRYECGNCGEVYENKDEAEECCEEEGCAVKCPADVEYCEACRFYKGDDDE